MFLFEAQYGRGRFFAGTFLNLVLPLLVVVLIGKHRSVTRESAPQDRVALTFGLDRTSRANAALYRGRRLRWQVSSKMVWLLLLILYFAAAMVVAAVIDSMVALIKRKRNKK